MLCTYLINISRTFLRVTNFNMLFPDRTNSKISILFRAHLLGTIKTEI